MSFKYKSIANEEGEIFHIANDSKTGKFIVYSEGQVVGHCVDEKQAYHLREQYNDIFHAGFIRGCLKTREELKGVK